MAVCLTGRSFVSIADFTREEIWQVLETAKQLKLERYRGQAHPLLSGKTLGMIFQKPSLRTRVSFEAGMTQLGGHAIYLAPTDISIGERETTEDIAIVLGRMCDLIMARTFGHDIVEELARHAGVPVINGLSEREHPCQVLADLLTVWEKRGTLAGQHLVYVGDGNNVAHSLMLGCALVDMRITIATPPGFEPERAITTQSQGVADAAGGTVDVSNDVLGACRAADVIYTDVWASMGQEDEAADRAAKFAALQVNEDLVSVAKDDCTILHCLPAHYGDEITYAASRLPTSAIFDQAENRLHAQKGLMALLTGSP